MGEQARVVAGNLTTSGNGWHAIDVDKTGSWLKLGGINSFNENPKVPVIYVDDVNVGTIGVIDSPNLYGHIDNTGHLLDAVNYRTGDRAYFLALDAPELVAPSNNSSVKGASLTNSWTAVSGADHYVYESYNDDDASANSLRWRESFTSTSKTATNVANATFWWRVKAVNSFGLESSWSSLYKVTVDNTAPSVPTFTMYDADGNVITSDITTKDFKFVLNSSSDVVRYQLRYTNDIAGAAVSSWSPNDISATGHMATLGEYIDNFTQGEGVHHFSFSACDAAGNCSAFSTPFTVNYSKTAPAVANPETPVTPNPPANNQDNSGQAGANNGGQQGASTGAVANGFTNVTVDGQTAADNTDNTGDSVLGEQDNKTAEKISTYDDGETTPEVKGASDEKGCTKFLGICWYYWIPIVIVVVVLGRWLYGTLRRRGEGNA